MAKKPTRSAHARRSQKKKVQVPLSPAVTKLVELVRHIGGTHTSRPVWLFRWFLFLCASGLVLGCLLLFIAYKMIDIPDPNADFTAETTTVYFSDGHHKIGQLATQNRQSITLSEVPKSMQSAVIAAEDRSFYSNRGIDFKGVLRALRSNATSGEIQAGGSTITQQYVKLLYLSQERTITRKVREAILALKISKQLSKSQVLEGYLNTVYFGNGAYGVEVAAHTYFNKSAKELTIPESASLAAIINIPSYYDPYVKGGKERLVDRYNYVLNGMLDAGDITSEQAAKYYGHLPHFSEHTVSNRYGGPNGFLLRVVEQQMQKLQFPDSQINGGGLSILTTFNYENQKAAVSAIDQINQSTPANAVPQLHRALVSIEPGRGAVRAMYGGPDYLKSQLNWALLGTQPGSTFKVFGLVAALNDGFSLNTRLNGNSPMKIGEYEVENQGDSGGQAYGIINLTKATEHSVNTAYLDLEYQLGDDNWVAGARKVKDAAEQLGVPGSTIDNIDNVPTAVLGYAQVAPIDMADAYATIAAGGMHADWYVIEKVTARDGRVLHEHKVKTERVIPEKVAGDALVAMQTVVRTGTGSRARSICPVGGKTGTATAGNGKNQWVSSSWFIGTSPKLTTAVMQNRGRGNEDLEAILGRFFIGGGYPAQTFKLYNDQVLKRSDCGVFPGPGNIRGTKGQTFSPTPTIKCPDGFEAKGKRCQPIGGVPCKAYEKPDPASGTCVPRNSPPTPTLPASPTATVRPPANSFIDQANCTANGYTWDPALLGGMCIG